MLNLTYSRYSKSSTIMNDMPFTASDPTLYLDSSESRLWKIVKASPDRRFTRQEGQSSSGQFMEQQCLPNLSK